jgi:hypothetical protein
MKTLFITFILCAATSANAHASLTPDAIIAQLDDRGLPPKGFEARTRITPIENGIGKDSASYLIKSRSRNQVLVEGISDEQRGQKFLTSENGLFFKAPRSMRAIRITPLQALWGQASIGDISRLSWGEDYTAKFDTKGMGDCPKSECVTLELNSKNDQATYARVRVQAYREGARFRPLRAELYVASGKLTKMVEYVAGKPEQPATQRFIDPRDPSKITELAFDGVKPASFPDALFNPRSLEQ